jgi:hypothetical protein
MIIADSWLHVVEVIILVLGALFAIREIHSNALREHRRNSMEIDTRLAEFADERRIVENAFPPSEWKEPISFDRLQAAFKADDKLETALLRVVERMELLAIPVCAKAADEDMAFELAGSTMVRYATVFRSYIDFRRSNQNRPDFYIYLTTLVDTRWRARHIRERELISQGSLPLFLRCNCRLCIMVAEHGASSGRLTPHA